MILSCPSCRTRYVVPDSAIGVDGRKVRCAQCRFSWFQEGPEQLIASPPQSPPPPPPPAPVRRPEPEPREPAYDEPAPAAPAYRAESAEPESSDWAYGEGQAGEEPRRPRRNPARLWTLIAVIAALLMVGAVAAVYFIGPQQIAAWMGAGEAPTADALRFTRREVSREPLPTNTELLTVTGEITNVSDRVQRVPQIRAEVTDAQQRVIFSWTIAPPVTELQPHQSATFSSASTDVPRGGRNLNLSFGPTT